MPREQITFDTTSEVSDDNGAAVVERAEASPYLHVTWLNRNDEAQGWVQVSLEATLPYLAVVTASPNGSQPDTTKLFTDVLSIDDIDRLIRVLKHAKRKAYGKAAS